MLAAARQDAAAAKVDRLRHFVAADLTRLEIETLRSYFRDLEISAIWRYSVSAGSICEVLEGLEGESPWGWMFGAGAPGAL